MKGTQMLLVLMLMYGTASSQTKKIAHKSHSGSVRSFSLKGSGSFGIVHKEKYKAPKKDSVSKTKDTTGKKPALPVKQRKKPVAVDPRYTRP